MPSKILEDYQGQSIKIDGVCYNFVGETTAPVNATPSELGGTFASCLECALESSSSSVMYSESSSSSFDPQSESSSSSFDPQSESSSSSGGGGGGDPAPKVCPTVNGVTDPPDIILRVSNLGATETVNWCGETWNLGTGGDNMKEFRVCPGFYDNDGTYHRWNNGSEGVLNSGIYLGRVLAASPSTRRNYIYFYWSGLGGPTLADFVDGSGVQQSDLGVVTGVPVPTSNDYLITDSFFGSYTDGSNRTFTWRRGDKWPTP